jgi:hypothetical protein
LRGGHREILLIVRDYALRLMLSGFMRGMQVWRRLCNVYHDFDCAFGIPLVS